MRHIDPVALRSVSSYADKQETDLKEAVKTLLDDIKKITDFYQGEEAVILQQKYENRLRYLINTYSTNIENVSTYFKEVSNAHSKNLEDSKKSISEAVELTNNETNPVSEDITFSNDILNKNDQVKA